MAEKSAGTTANRPIQDKWAVIIGVSRFASPQIPTLKYPSKDALDFYNFLVTKGNFARDHVLLLRDDRATKINILDAFGDGFLPRRVLENDLVVVFISSHGSPADVAGENFIIAYDTDPRRPYATGIRLQDLSSELTKRTSCDRIVLLLDACHSGAAVIGEKGMSRAPSNFALDSITGVGQLVISSSRPDESSWESKRYPNGVFTKQLIGALEATGPQARLAQVYDKLRDNVQQEVRFDRVASQTPMMLNKWQGLDVPLCAPAAAPRTVLPELKDQQTASSTTDETPTSPDAQHRPAFDGDRTAQSNTPAAIPRSPYVANNSSRLDSPPSRLRPAQDLSRAEIANSSTDSYVRSTNRPTRPPRAMFTDWRNNGGDPTLESGTRLIRSDEIENCTYRDLLYIYNEPYARHGRGFTMTDIQQYFDRQPWYQIDPDYHYRSDDPRVISRGTTDDPLIINERRTPKQFANIITIKRMLDSKRRRSSN